MQEIEAKILEIDRVAVEKKLRVLGAQKVFDGNLDVRYFDTPTRRLGKRGIVLRLRKKGSEAELTIKRNLVSIRRAKQAEELELKVDFKTAYTMMYVLGFIEQSRMTKHRFEYVLDTAHIEIDKIANIPWLLEIEASSEKEITSIAERLGFRADECKPWWWKDVKKYYAKKGILL